MIIEPEDIIAKELKDLIQGCVANDRSSQRRIYAFYSSVMMALCLRYAKNRQEAEEVLQDGFLQMFKNINQFQYKGSFEGWLRRIMINCALQRHRGKLHEPNLIAIPESQHFLSMQTIPNDRLSEKEMLALIQSLPPAYRMVFNLYVFEGLKHREIAVALGITEGTSKSNLSDARQILKKQLTPKINLIR